MRVAPAFRPSPGLSSSLVALLILAGCASGPKGPESRWPSPARDGPPLVTPPDLANAPDPEPKVEPIRQGGPNKPYSVLGQSYTPMASDEPWTQRGMASWYGQKFHGRRTASGELYSLYGLTAAHKTLPIPSYVRVRHIASGREIIVRVNDRGPFHSDRVLDLSYAAALKLGIVGMGSAEVEIQRLTFDDIRTGAWRRGGSGPGIEPPPDDPIMALAQATPVAVRPVSTPNPAPTSDASAVAPAGPVIAVSVPPQALPSGSSSAAAQPVAEASGRAYTPAAQGYWVQLAALGRRDGVDKLQQRVNAELSSLTPLLAVFQEASLYRLQVGPYESREQAQGVARAVRQALALTPMVIERR